VTADRATPARVVRLAWISWVAVCVIWGTTYLGIKICLETIPPFLMGGLRYVTAGGILATILVARGRALPPPSEWGKYAVLGFFMLFAGNGGVVWGEQFISSGLTAVFIATSPFWMVGVDAMLPNGPKLHARDWFGLAVGFAGILVLVGPDVTIGGTTARNAIVGAISVQLACVGWAIGSAYTKRHVTAQDVLGSAALQMTFGGLFMLIAGTILGEWGSLSFTARTGWMLAYLTFIGALVAYAAFSYSLKHLDMAIVSLYSYVNPVIAVALGTLVLDEPFHMRMVLAAAIIVGGILMVKPRKT
jgi:drug/metabolite transporter (DMT)-like permease